MPRNNLPDLKQLDKTGRLWVLQRPYSVNICFSWVERVDAGFETDLASIPRPFWWLFSPAEFTGPSIIHDQLCRRSRTYSDRVCADAGYLHMLHDQWGVSWFKTVLQFVALRLYAWLGLWRRDRGDMRISKSKRSIKL